MNLEEKQAIEMMKFYQEEYRKQIKTLKGNGEPEGYGTIIDTIKGRICNIQLVLNLIEKKQAELKKEKTVINEMAKEIADITGSCPYDKYDYGLDCSLRCEEGIEAECWVEYFTNKVEREGK